MVYRSLVLVLLLCAVASADMLQIGDSTIADRNIAIQDAELNADSAESNSRNLNFGACSFSQNLLIGAQATGDDPKLAVMWIEEDSVTAVSTDSAEIDSARWFCFVAAVINGPSTSVPYAVYMLKRAWGEGDNCGTTADANECSFNEAKSGTDAWQTPGALGANDQESTPLVEGTMVESGTAAWKTFDITDYVKRLVSGSTNYGIAVRYNGIISPPASYGYFDFLDTEYGSGYSGFVRIWYTPDTGSPRRRRLINSWNGVLCVPRLHCCLY